MVGAGAAGMTAALAAAKQGLDTVLLEKSGYFGGSTARSGGGVWIPDNYALKAAGEADGVAEAKRYLDAIVGDVVPKVRRDTFLDRGPEVLDFVRDHTPLRFTWVPEYADYHPERARRAPARPLLRTGADGRLVPGRRARAAAPAVHQGAGQHDRHAGRLPEDQSRPPHGARPDHDGQGAGAPPHQPAAAPAHVRHGQRDRDRVAAGSDRRRRAGALRERARRAGARRRPGGRREGRARRRGARGPSPPGRDPRQRRLREEPRPAREAPATPHLGRLDDGQPVQHRRWHPGGGRGRRRDRPDGRRLVGTHDPAAERTLVLPGRTQPAGLDHRQPGRDALHERGAPLRRGGARDLPGRGHRRRSRAGVDGDRPALPQPLPVRRPRPAPALPGPLVQARHGGEGRHPRAPWPSRSTSRPTLSRPPSSASTASPARAPTRTSTAASRATTGTTPIPP